LDEVYTSVGKGRASRVEILGTVHEMNGTTIVGSISSIRNLFNSTLPDPYDVKCEVLGSNCTADAEGLEGVLVRLTNVSITSNLDRFNRLAITDGSGGRTILDDSIIDAADYLTNKFGSNLVGKTL
jgi:hypothetical protein